MMSVRLYYMHESPPCRAVQMLAAHIKLPLDLKYVNLATGEHKKPDFVTVNPHAVIPTIVDGDFVLWESRTILKYLVNKGAPDSSLYPSDPRLRAKIDQVLDFDIGRLYQSLGQFLGPILRGKKSDTDGEAKFKSNLKLLEDMLVNGFAYSVSFDFTAWPNIRQWKEKLRHQITDYAAINDEPMARFTAYMKDKLHLITPSTESIE